MSMPVRNPRVSSAPIATPAPTAPTLATRVSAPVSREPSVRPAFSPCAPMPVICWPIWRWKLENRGAMRTVAAPALANAITVLTGLLLVRQQIVQELALSVLVELFTCLLDRGHRPRRRFGLGALALCALIVRPGQGVQDLLQDRRYGVVLPQRWSPFRRVVGHQTSGDQVAG